MSQETLTRVRSASLADYSKGTGDPPSRSAYESSRLDLKRRIEKRFWHGLSAEEYSVADTIEDVIERWRTGIRAEALPADRDDAVTAWVAEITALVVACGFTEDDLNNALDDNPRTWAENEYDQRSFGNKPL